MRRTILVCMLAACLLAGTARADGDPASDFLLSQKVFFPFDAKIPQAKQRELLAVVEAANRAGLHIRVALISSSYDLGAIVSLWRKPRTYARFLGAELEFVYKQQLLVVMPNGFGFFWHGHPADPAYKALGAVPIGAGATGLSDAAAVAVRTLATQAGIGIPSVASTKHRGPATTLIILLSLAGVALLVALRIVLRRRS